MQKPPFEVTQELQGWTLYWAEMKIQPGHDEELRALRLEVAERVREQRDIGTLAADSTVSGLRKLFRAAGCDPTRYRPASEALIRRLLKGSDVPSIHPLVDINNCLSALLAVPCCVMTTGTFQPPLLFRSGQPGESYESLRGPFNLESKPLLLDTIGPLDAPITGSQRVKVTPETAHAWLVAYLPGAALTAEEADRQLRLLLEAAPVAQLISTSAC